MITEKIKDLEDRGKKLTKKRIEPLEPGDQDTETRQKLEDRTHLLTGYYIPRGIPRQIHSKQMILKTSQEGEKVAVELPD